MIIDCHGHYTTSPKQLQDWRDAPIAALKDPGRKPTKGEIKVSDDEIRASVEGAQLKIQRERGTDLTIFSPRASGMGHHIGDATTSERRITATTSSTACVGSTPTISSASPSCRSHRACRPRTASPSSSAR